MKNAKKQFKERRIKNSRVTPGLQQQTCKNWLAAGLLVYGLIHCVATSY